MKTERSDQLSAYFDEELDHQEESLLLARLCRDEEFRSTFYRYSLIGSAMRDGEEILLDTGLVDNVASALETEAEHNTRTRQPSPRVLTAAAGLAVAAAVAALAIVNLPGTGVAPESDRPAASVAGQPSYTVPPNTLEPVENTRVSTRLTGYLMNHSEFSPAPVRRNVLYEIIGREEASGDPDNDEQTVDSSEEIVSQ